MLILFSVYHSGLGLVEPIPNRITANTAKGAIAYASRSCIVGSHLPANNDVEARRLCSFPLPIERRGVFGCKPRRRIASARFRHVGCSMGRRAVYFGTST